MHMEERRRQTDLQKIGQMLGIPTIQIDGNNFREVTKVAKSKIGNIRSNKGPEIIECLTYRWRGHVGTSWDTDVGVKRKNELDVWKLRDPILREKDYLLKEGLLERDLSKAEDAINEKLNKSLTSALEASFPEPSTLMNHVFVEGKENV